MVRLDLVRVVASGITLQTESPSIFLNKSTHLGNIEATLLAG